ncbi:hypothetical protein D3C74_200120 [compost metagenome]
MRPKQMLHKELLTFRRAGDQVRAPNEQRTREVLRRIRVLHSELRFTGYHLLVCVLDDLGVVRLALSRRFFGEGQAALVKLRIRGQPAQPSCQHIVIRRMTVRDITAGWRFQRFRAHLLVLPLVGGKIEERSRVLQPRRRLPVASKCDRRPAFDRPAFLLPYIVSPAAAVNPLRSRQHHQVQNRAVDRITVEPVVDPGAHNDH